MGSWGILPKHLPFDLKAESWKTLHSIPTRKVSCGRKTDANEQHSSRDMRQLVSCVTLLLRWQQAEQTLVDLAGQCALHCSKSRRTIPTQQWARTLLVSTRHRNSLLWCQTGKSSQQRMVPVPSPHPQITVRALKICAPHPYPSLKHCSKNAHQAWAAAKDQENTPAPGMTHAHAQHLEQWPTHATAPQR